MYGSLDLTRDEVGLEHARVLHGILGKIVAALEGDQDLPDEALAPEKPSEVENPFARASASMSAAEFHAGAIITEAVDDLAFRRCVKGAQEVTEQRCGFRYSELGAYAPLTEIVGG